MKKVSLKDIARMADVAPSTVSFVLNGKARQMRISDTLKNKIIAVAQKAGYHPNQVAVSLRTGKSQILGLIVENISNTFFAMLAKTIEDEAEKFGYKVLYCSTENNTRKGQELIRVLSQQQIGGYLIAPTQGMKDDILSLIAQNKCVVLMDRYFPELDIPSVSVDNFAGVTVAIEHLTDKGYRKIGFVTVDLDLVQMHFRERAYKEALKKAGIDDNSNFILKLKYGYKKQNAIHQVSTFIKENKLQAIFFSTNYLGILGLESIQEAGLRIPEDIAVISFDDHDIFKLYRPGITSVQQPVKEIARTAVQLLMGQIGETRKTLKKNHFQLAAKMIFRGST